MYKDYYDAKTNHRRLAWTHSLGQCSLKGTFSNGKKSYDLQVTTLQAVVMLAFNKDANCPGGVSGAPISFVSLQEALNIPEDTLKRVIHSLACGKIKILKRVAGSTAGSSSSGAAAAGDKVTPFNEEAAGGTSGAGGAGEKLPPQKGVAVTDTYAFNELFK